MFQERTDIPWTPSFNELVENLWVVPVLADVQGVSEGVWVPSLFNPSPVSGTNKSRPKWCDAKNSDHQRSVHASVASSCALLAFGHWEALPPLVLTWGLMAGWRRQGDRSLPRPGAWTSRRTASRSKSPVPRRNSSGKSRRPARSAAR